MLVKSLCLKYARYKVPVSSLLPCATGTKSFPNDRFGFKIIGKSVIQLSAEILPKQWISTVILCMIRRECSIPKLGIFFPFLPIRSNIFYRACIDIPRGTELLVWYNDSYTSFFGIPLQCIAQDENCKFFLSFLPV